MSNNVEAIYPLSPMQEGMLFHTAYAPGTGIYVNQVAYTFNGLDADAFRGAWQAALDRHAALRSAFLWEKRDRALQAVLRAVELPWDERDWRGLDGQAQQAALEALMHEDRTRGFALSRPPALRLYVMRTADDEHRVLWSFHHLVLDGWSMSLLLGEVFRLYDALRRGESPALPPAPQYRAYITWLQAQRPADAEAFWRGALAGVEGPTPLGVDRGDAAVSPGDPARYAQLSVPIPPETAAAVQAFARRAQLTANTVVQGAWALLLSRYGGSRDVLFGVTMSGRPAALAGAEQTVGLFINTLPARVAVPEAQGVLPWLRDVQRHHAELQQHGHVPLVEVHGWSAVPRDQPLFETVLAFQNFPSQRAERQAGGLQVRDVKVTESPGLPLTLSVGIGAESFLKVMYDRTRITDETAARLPAHFTAALDAIAAGAERRVGELGVLDAGERVLVLEEWNRTAAEYPADRCIHELFEVQAARTPGAVAVVHEGEALSYAELNARANQLAHHLRRRGVGPEVRVGICLERSLELVVSLLAVLKAGGAYVPLDPAYPAERLERIAADAGLALLLTAESLRDAVPAPAGLRVVYVDAAWPVIAAESTENPESGAGPNTLAYVIYTSGSTGTPKGVAVQHASVVSHMSWFIREFQVGPRDRVLQKTPISFDASVWEFHVPLLAGARLVLAAPGGEREPRYLARTVREQGITLLQLVPPLLRVLADEPELPECGALRLLFCGGEALAGELARRAGELLPAARVVNLYGPTECCIQACTHACVGEDGGLDVVPIGRPVANTRAYVLDPGLRPTAPGVPGELYLGGVQVARGYLGRAALTAERFVPDPFAARPGSRLYRTGDRARWRADGAIEYLGRLDDQVKVRGFRIELGEIEAVLRRHESVADCVVTASEQRLVAYVAGESGAEALRAHVRHSLPEYMVPSAFVFLEALPLMPNGKLDRKALPTPELARAEDRYAAPRTRVEEVLAGIWAEVLGLERVGVEDSFFDLGGHSLLAMRLVSRVREKLGVELPLRAIFDGPTVAEIARSVEDERRGQLPVLPPVVPTGRTGALPLSFAQERLWFVDRMEPGSAVYNLPVAWRLAGALDVDALERSLGEIVRRHGVLRTVIAEAGGSPVQVVAPFGGFAMPVEDLSGLGEAEREAAVGRRAGEEARRPFDLTAGPLFRAALLRLGAGEHVLLLSMHHIVSDGWSMEVLYRELSALYVAYGAGRTSPLAELPVQYADYAVWQREQLEGEILDRQLSYWRERLAGAPELLELPTDLPRPPVPTFRGAYERIELPLQLLERLQALGRSQGATLYMVLLGVFQVLLSKYSGTEDVVVGSPIAGRNRKEAEELIGFFVNTLVLRTDLSGDPDFREVLRRVREVTLGAYEHQEVPFERLVAELQPERSLSHSPLFQVMFVEQNAAAGGPALPGLEVSGVEEALESAKFDLTLMVKATRHGLRVGVNYSTDLFERATVVQMLGHLAGVLEQVAADAGVRLSRLELLGDAERALVLQAWNRTERPYPRGVCIHELFEAQVRERPEAVALAWDGAELTYQELAARANRLAHHLVRRGVGPESRVGVLLERGAELIVSLLAVLKAGGCYVPLDPAYPAERLRLMLDDSSIRVLISRSGLAGVAETGGLGVVHLDRDADAIMSEPVEAPHSGATAENLAYIVYTSGSTGRPKGIMVGHRQVVQLVVETDYVQLRPGDHVAQASNAGFDALTFELWGAFLNGATLVGIPQDVLLSPPALRETLREQRVTTIFLTTALVNQLSHEQPDIFAPLREVLFGGQAVDADSVRRLLKAGGPQRLLHMYGPTETTTFCLYEQVEHVAEDALTVPLGHATGNQRIYLLDGALNPVPRGVPAEAYVSGAGVARGYLDRPRLTAERFVPDPFSGEPGARMYRTGDRMRWRGERKLEFVGRLDDQVKIRGFRIEPGEVESAVSAHPAVREAAIVVREDVPGDKRLVAYVVGEVEADEVRAFLRGSLPEYMLPAAFVFLDALPLTPNGKLDRKALPAPEPGPAGDRYVAPRTAVEEVLAGIWAEVLRLERVGVHDSFFEVGGHSLLATRVLAQIQASFGLEISIRDVFSMPTLEAMAGEIERRIYEDIATLSDDEAEQLLAANLVAGG